MYSEYPLTGLLSAIKSCVIPNEFPRLLAKREIIANALATRISPRIECKFTTNQWNHQTKRQKRCVFLDAEEKKAAGALWLQRQRSCYIESYKHILCSCDKAMSLILFAAQDGVSKSLTRYLYLPCRIW